MSYDQNFYAAKRSIELVKKYRPNLTKERLAVEAIEWDICDRRSIKHEWREIDDMVKLDIKEVWQSIIKQAMEDE